ncbi:MAG TPA: thioether cross-link-forming SCIFF peptide maturase, partial [Clostridia bacterium]|nr:thioether cross-link-forming SCIFF peptide maturase [Clostridia bacterium]
MIHKYKLNGYNIVLDVYSNSLHIVDDIAYDIISIYKEKSTEDIINTILEMHPEITKDDILECLSDISQLEKESKLFSEDTYSNIPIRKRSNSNIVKALCL